MYNSATPRLRADVVVRPFDAVEGDCRFVVAVDDRHFLVTAAVAAVLEESRHPNTLAALAQRVSARLGLTVSPEHVGRLLREQVPPILFQAVRARRERGNPMRLRCRMVSERALRPFLTLAARLLSARASILLAAMFVVVETLVVASALAAPPDAMTAAHVVTAVALTMFGVVIHELGHLAACAKYGAPHGGIGIGLYWCFPALYAEVHSAWRLARRQRAVVDAGGLYFQCGYVLVLGLLYLASGAPLVLAAIAWSHLLMLHTLNPVLKYDGYWLLADLTGAHNLHAKLRSIAQRAWRALRVQQLESLPVRNDLLLLGGFSLAALAYFAYLFVLLGRSVAAAASQVVEYWSGFSRAELPTPGAIGEVALLISLLAAAIGVSLLLARSLSALAHEGNHDR